MITVVDLRAFVRVIGDDLDDQLVLALTAGRAEAAAYLGRTPDEEVTDEAMGTLYLARSHFDDADADRCRQVGRLLLFPFRVGSGVGGA
ncbi:hypothetical protein [Pseudoxanthomonas winnipegensis]|uniref:Phage gp6-like head-tail connector protein n=1 Tax=Pseudoxanthomonas winnipegensis TaxID=2480810 RepID=A0A4Q8LED7_9GAMM|nr:hypothetical protein [Pseudoxanthomonas winnipegensis]RZZ88918.1 hypothetical protein EA662_00485 [Pseudoxanthomonas winnipegensis]TAA27373.1 hypothetical protein EA661_14705 [Pseudoxanthomonas winnipegensis]TBV75659.1 hypothetical protein EYC46_10300 [Pseudoxanthomonas winnipegensis]